MAGCTERVGLILCQLSPDGAAARNRGGPTSAAAQAAIAWTTERGCERELGEVTRNICMFFNSTGNSPSQLRALLVAKFLGSRLVPHTIHEESVTSRGAAYGS